MRRYGAEGQRLSRLARGIDVRAVDPVRERKSVSAETTFETDIAAFRPLEKRLWAAAEEVSARLKEKHLCGSTVTLKLKTADFRILTRARSLERPTQLAGKIFGAARDLLEREIDGTRYRLLGVGVSALADAEDADPADLIDHSGERRAAAERAMDRVRGQVRPRGRGQGPGAEGEGRRGLDAQKYQDAARLTRHVRRSPYLQGFASLISSDVISPVRTKSP